MRMETIRAACGLSRERGSMEVISKRNRVIETKKYKSKHVNAWKKEVRAYL